MQKSKNRIKMNNEREVESLRFARKASLAALNWFACLILARTFTSQNQWLERARGCRSVMNAKYKLLQKLNGRFRGKRAKWKKNERVCGRSVAPFVCVRTDNPRDDFFIWICKLSKGKSKAVEFIVRFKSLADPQIKNQNLKSTLVLRLPC